jgi:hypothetical protein
VADLLYVDVWLEYNRHFQEYDHVSKHPNHCRLQTTQKTLTSRKKVTKPLFLRVTFITDALPPQKVILLSTVGIDFPKKSVCYSTVVQEVLCSADANSCLERSTKEMSDMSISMIYFGGRSPQISGDVKLLLQQ